MAELRSWAYKYEVFTTFVALFIRADWYCVNASSIEPFLDRHDAKQYVSSIA